MRPLGVLRTEQQAYKVTMQEEGKRGMSEPRCPIKVYEKDDSGGWSHLETLDGEKPGTDKNKAYTRLKSERQAWQDAIDAIRFYDNTDIVDERKKF